MAQTRGLGKGLNALIPKGSVFMGGRTIVNIEAEKIVPNPRQPRTEFKEEALSELAESIKEHGIAQPILVRMRGGVYELIAGERRLRAAKLAGLKVVPAIVKDFSDQESLALALIENIQREDLNALDEAEAYKRLVDEFGFAQQEVAKQVGKSRSTVANMMRLLELPEQVKQDLKNGKISAGHARSLLSLEDEDKQLNYVRQIIDNKLSVRDVEIIIEEDLPAAKIKRRRRRAAHSDELGDVAELLTTKLSTKVRVHGNNKRGKIIIDYFNQEDLERLVEILTKH